jgi:cytochrome c biogenesis protein CcdA
MALFLLAYLGGVLTIVSPCILPVLPFVFARADRPFVRSELPMLAGMAVTFAAVATLAAVAGAWAVAVNQYGRAAPEREGPASAAKGGAPLPWDQC